MATTVTESGGVRIITEVIPATDPRAAQLASGSIQPTVSSFQVSGFRRAQPKVLGLLVSGSLLVESEKRENILLVKVCCVANAAVILSTLVAMLIHTVAITHSIPGCSSSAGMPLLVRQEWCFSAETKALSNGFDSILVLFGLLEFCTAVAALAFGCTAIKQYSYTRMVL
ncbi:uncharacterized protein LOC122155477 isoform X3 [Centrocercus urophasianus]|uniref:uncharacterized protein LOC122155477 isoform X3 n=1 Tax=Centrocercus urophasianus TaxID=9002 RepID=UPI001C6456AB|nr:uncharacterized protein LOC122155477 isoform X3 [Centrocercus urophasianus]